MVSGRAKNTFNVKVGTDQSLINPMSLMGMVEAEGSITVSSSEFTEHLNYILDSEQLDDMFGDEVDPVIHVKE